MIANNIKYNLKMSDLTRNGKNGFIGEEKGEIRIRIINYPFCQILSEVDKDFIYTVGDR